MRDIDAIDALARTLAGRPIDFLLNNAGVNEPLEMTLGNIDYVARKEILAVDTLVPARFAGHFAASERKPIACISRKMGSIAVNTEGRHYLYRSSKTALNAVVKSLSIPCATGASRSSRSIRAGYAPAWEVSKPIWRSRRASADSSAYSTR